MSRTIPRGAALLALVACADCRERAGGDMAGMQMDHVPGERGPVLLDPARRQAIGVRTERASVRAIERDVRATGIVRTDERLERHIHLKFEGFVERVFVNFVGRAVRRGERLLSVYSPELYAAEAELAQALAARDRPRAGPFAKPDLAQAEALVEAARARLLLLDVPAAEVERLERTRGARRTLVIDSPIDGTVMERNVRDGMRVMPETALFVVADLSRVWILASVFEQDIAAVRVGDVVRVEFAGDAVPSRAGTISFVSPTIDEATRTAQARVEVDNTDGAVRPGLYAQVTIRVPTEELLAVPIAAVIETGLRTIVFVETAPGRFEPREVRLGARAREWAEVEDGVVAGEAVAVSAQFLLDAESQIRAGPREAPHGGH
ncbi:MAG: efflux RND transporter periplasmic adaptor subunit [Deltaproteobacteria bacterium]|nr:efflux RND transporter periplasmic adaptor subunit [Deltaproteobacteria bacterium]